MNRDESADIPTIGHKHLEEFSPAFPSYPHGQCQVSFINLPCGQYTSGSTARRSDELAHNTFASSPDRGDACIMQGRNPLVNGFVVEIFMHYILSDNSHKAIIQAPDRGLGR
ncbi:MAG: hypothetical protein ACN6QY_15810 [Pseudomonas sp.]|uniref:hypothetical protein n=1 Tax=unclassified Pseudomonas TaxID=196821 RepID=UPI001CF96119|nr:hypothetical protein [Pseudomonas sp. L5B5]UCZ86106.1 hypothetical protein LGQ10_07325 [Pseudomonas sp. L5B5]